MNNKIRLKVVIYAICQSKRVMRNLIIRHAQEAIFCITPVSTFGLKIKRKIDASNVRKFCTTTRLSSLVSNWKYRLISVQGCRKLVWVFRTETAQRRKSKCPNHIQRKVVICKQFTPSSTHQSKTVVTASTLQNWQIRIIYSNLPN